MLRISFTYTESVSKLTVAYLGTVGTSGKAGGLAACFSMRESGIRVMGVWELAGEYMAGRRIGGKSRW